MLKRKGTIWTALAGASLLESLRRKDLYVALILSLLMIGAAATIGTFGVTGLEMFLKDVTLTVVNLVSTLLAVLFAARQLPEEVAHRTVYPLLARPISRADLVIGKFFGAFALSALALLLFAMIGLGALSYYGLAVGAIFWQYLLLRLFSLALVCALTITLSLFLTPGATITVALLLAAGGATFSQAVLLLDGTAGQAARAFLRGSYYLLPHLDLFDLSRKVSYGWKPVAAWVVWALFAYGALYTALLLALGMWRFKRQAV
jgi:ABC-type transport system involved in multi-copper enzyme maturation permease subunit